jgi:outer membrane scaffolding protein for murein synthesis (MipA/OmpV family)
MVGCGTLPEYWYRLLLPPTLALNWRGAVSCKYLRVAALCLLATSLLAHPARAAEDDGSEQDAKRYIGLTFGSTGFPYIGSERSLWMFPMYRTFDDSAITDDLIISREGSIGLRWTRDRGIQFGVLARLQSLGYKASDNLALAGMGDRNQTLEAGPFVGWRGEHVNVDLAVYRDVLGEHSGQEVRLVVSAPFEVAQRFMILHLDVYQQSAGMADYYFGVLPGEAAAGRPAYTPGSSVNLAIGVRTGWHIGKRLGVFLDLGADYYGSEIEASPIVDSNIAWNVSIGVGYNF